MEAARSASVQTSPDPHWRIGDQSIRANIVELHASVLSILREGAQQHPRHEVLILLIRALAHFLSKRFA
jgi:hypothetical protein